MKCLRDKKMLVGRVVALVAALLLTCAVFPRVARADEGSVRIHVLNFYEDEDAILIESDGRFGMVDSGEDDDYPKGNDARYPYRSGTRVRKGHQDEVIAYLERMGVTSDNFEFYIGTHPHSDHIGSADDVIKTFKPQRVYSPDYKDSYLSDPWRLWDNLYIFDQMKAAAKKVEDSIEETLTFMDFPSQHWTRIRTNNTLERLNREIKRRTRAIGAFPDGNSALMLVCARLRHVAGSEWGIKRYMNMEHLLEIDLEQEDTLIG